MQRILDNRCGYQNLRSGHQLLDAYAIGTGGGFAIKGSRGRPFFPPGEKQGVDNQQRRTDGNACVSNIE